MSGFPSSACSPSAIVQQLSGLEKLIIIGKAGDWRDGNEIQCSDRLEQPFKEWLYDNDGEVDSDYELWGEGTEDDVSEEPEDFWHCYGPIFDGDPRAYKPFHWWDERERRYGSTGHCRLALVDYSKIPNVAPTWGIGGEPAGEVLTDFRDEFAEMKEYWQQAFEEHEDENCDEFINWGVWIPPKVKLALCRRTAKSCYVQDWGVLEKDWMDEMESVFADQFPEKYARTKVVREHYPPGLLLLVGMGSGGCWGEVRVPREGEEIEEIEETEEERDDEDDFTSDDLDSEGSESSNELPELS
jgi:hypothetical protein